MEILSPATALKDRNSKFFLYQEMGIKYFLVIDIDKVSIEIYTLENNQYHLIDYNVNQAFQFVLDGDCNIDVELNNIWE